MGDTRTYNIAQKYSMYNVDFGGHVRKISKDVCQRGSYYDKGNRIDISYNSDRGIYEAKVSGEFPNYISSKSSSSVPVDPGLFSGMKSIPSDRSTDRQLKDRVAFLQEQSRAIRASENSSGSYNKADVSVIAAEIRNNSKSSSPYSSSGQSQEDRIAFLRQQAKMLTGK